MTTTGAQGIMQRLLTDKPTFHSAWWDCLPETLSAPVRDERERGGRMINMTFIDAVPRVAIPCQLMP
jgi:hypothetical protein